MGLTVASDAMLDREMAYTEWRTSCRSPHPEQPDLVCRRPFDHPRDECVSGFGSHRQRWECIEDPRPDFAVVPIFRGTHE